MEFDVDIKNCLDVLSKGGSILYPTDTIWGLGCDPTNDVAVDKISEIKNRPASKSYIVLMSDLQMLMHYVPQIPSNLNEIIAQQNGPTTIIFPTITGIASNVLAADGSLGIRIPKDDFCQALLHSFGKPLLSTSANLSGEPNPSFFKEIDAKIIERSDYVVSWRQEDEEPKNPSNILKLNSDGSLVKIR